MPDTPSWPSAQPSFARSKRQNGEPLSQVHRISCRQAKRRRSYLLFPDFDFASWMVCLQTFICPVQRFLRWCALSPAVSESLRHIDMPLRRATVSTATEIACVFASGRMEETAADCSLLLFEGIVSQTLFFLLVV